VTVDNNCAKSMPQGKFDRVHFSYLDKAAFVCNIQHTDVLPFGKWLTAWLSQG
jgi:hypothetical protein